MSHSTPSGIPAPTAPRESAKRDPRGLLARYFLGLFVVVALIVFSGFLEYKTVKSAEKDAAHINESGRQRMLSQRILLAAEDLARGRASENVMRLEDALNQFEMAHVRLSRDPWLPEQARGVYFIEKNGVSLDQIVREYISDARDVLRGEESAAILERMRKIAPNVLLPRLDEAVHALEHVSRDRLLLLARLELAALSAAVATILLEMFLIFLPGHRLVSQALTDLERRNADLISAQEKLSEQNEDLNRQSVKMKADAERLRRANAESEALRREQSDFVFAMSHDMKSPANTLKLLLNELAVDRDALSQDASEALDDSFETIDRMTHLIEDALCYARATGDNARRAPISLDDLVAEVLADMDSEFEQAGASVERTTLPVVTGDATQLRLLLQNLISNAAKFRHADRAPQIKISATSEADNSATITVTDNGIGIDPMYHDRIFGLFQRLHTRDAYSGAGLGLTLCKRVVANHGGDIRVHSSPNQGATFEFSLRES